MNQPAEFASLFKLPFKQRLQLVQDLWDSIAEEAASLPVPEWQIDELRRRAARYDAGETPTLTWDEVKRTVREGR
ncbi:MAG: addiction module protein [Burkholderiaceae bacterium]